MNPPRFDPVHPRPTLQRAGWTRLDGAWECHLDREATVDEPDEVTWDASIVVPFAPETEASGLSVAGFLRRVWYRRLVDLPERADGERVLLHLGAVDRVASVWVDGRFAARHVGGSTPFTVDLTPRLDAPGPVEVVVRADDDPHDLAVPRGKQDWEAEPHDIFYPRTTGIWQTVWLEVVPACRITSACWWPDATGTRLDVVVEGPAPEGAWLEVALHHWPAGADQPDDGVMVRERVALAGGPRARTARRQLPVLGDIPELADLLRWSPAAPNLLAAAVRVVGDDGTVHDEVSTYTGLRTVGVADGHVTLNDQRTQLRLALDQGYWRSSGMTAPDDGALRRDVEAALALGLNGVRKHQKVEDPRFLHWADRLGLLVWEEQPSAFQHGPGTLEALTAEWSETVRRDLNHPSVIAWVPLNESWGVGAADLHGHPDRERHAAAIVTLAALTRALDPTRPVSANDGWETVGGDLVGVHDYTNDPEGFRRRYATREAVDETLRRRRPGGRRITLDRTGAEGRAVVLSELGGLTLAPSAEGLFGYGNTTSSDELLARYADLCRVLAGCRGLAGWCWTQLTDTYQEANGLLDMDRRPKAPLERLRAATLGLGG